MFNRNVTVFMIIFFLLLWWLSPALAYRVVASCPSATAAYLAGQAGVDPVVDVNGNICAVSASDPVETPVTNSATGTIAATPATLAAGGATKTTFVCGFSVRSNATAAATGNVTLAGVIGGTMNFTHITQVNTADMGITDKEFYPCLPASALNTAITVTSPAPGTGGVVSTTIWGFQK